jgi:hypothetical protein
LRRQILEELVLLQRELGEVLGEVLALLQSEVR